MQSSGPMRLVDLRQKLGASAADFPADDLDPIFVVEVEAVDEFWALAEDLFLDGGNQRAILFFLSIAPCWGWQFTGCADPPPHKPSFLQYSLADAA